MQMAQKGKNGRTFAFGQELWYTRKKKRGRICMEIRKGTLKDLEAIAAVEAACFPAAEAATAEEFAGRLQQYGNHFWLLWEGETLLAFVDGFCTDQPDLTDEMYADASLHRENGAWQIDLWGKHHPGLPQAGVRRAAAAAGHCRRPGPGPEGAGTDLQGGSGALLCKVRFCERGCFRLHPRGRGVVSDAAEVLKKPSPSWGKAALCNAK